MENVESFELYYKEVKLSSVKEYCVINSNYKNKASVFVTNEYEKGVLNKRFYLNICGE